MIDNKQQTPHGFCETPEQKCTMNYCDENGCQNRKRILAEPTDMTNNKQQTVVQLIIQALDIECKSRGMNVNWDMYLEMEKERIIEFAQSYAVIHCMGDITKNADEYYNETYGGGEK